MGLRVGIIGASVAGLLAARSLRDIAAEIVLFERDDLPQEPAVRKSVPQGAHAHVLLARGAKLLDAWFDGLFEEVAARGGLTGDMSAGSNWFHFGTWKRRLNSGVVVHFQSRLLLEHTIRQRVLALPNVRLKRTTIDKVAWPDERPTVFFADDASDSFDLLIDASGRGSKMRRWLSDAGRPSPDSESVEVNVTYTSARYRPQKPRDYQALLVYPRPPHERRAGGLLPVEDGHLLLSLFGWCGERPDGTDQGMLDYARSLPRPEIAEFLLTADRLTELKSFTYKEARRLRVDRKELPPRTCIIGDALCSVDPVFGQGMTLAAMQADALARTLHGDSDLTFAARKFNQRALRITNTAWMLSTGEDFRFPEVEGRRPLGLSFSHWYTGQIHRLVATDEEVYRRFARVMNLLEEPTHLFHPKIMAKVLWSGLVPPKAVHDRPTSL